MLIEKGVDFDQRYVDLLSFETLRPSFMELNHKGTVPTLVVRGGPVITDSKAIVEFVDTMADGRPLGGQAVDRQQVQEWVDEIGGWVTWAQ
jgi:GST-like protein